MFEQGFTFKKSAWHARLMKYIWNLGPRDFDYMCPYFWLSVFNVIIAPVVLPIKFVFWNLIPYICKNAIWPFIVWNYEGFERVLSAMVDKFDAWAVENQRKWDEKREKEMLEFRGRAIEFLESIPEKILDTGIKITQYQLWLEDPVNHAQPPYISWDDKDSFWAYHKAMSKKEKRMWAIFGGVTKKNSKAPAKIVESIKDKAAAEHKGDSFTPFVYVAETPEEQVERLRKQAIWKAAQKKKKDEEDAKKAEEERIKKLRAEEAEKKRLAEREKYLIRQRRRETQRLRNKQRINAILKFAKPIATAIIWIVGILAAIVGLYLVMKGVVVVWGFFKWTAEGIGSIKHTSYVKVGNVFKWIGLVVLAVAALLGLLALINYWVESIKAWAEKVEAEERIARHAKTVYADPIKEAADKKRKALNRQKRQDFWEGIGAVFVSIGSIFPPVWRVIKFIGKFTGKILKLILITPFVKIWKGLVTFVQIVRQTYNDNCPPITWKD